MKFDSSSSFFTLSKGHVKYCGIVFFVPAIACNRFTPVFRSSFPSFSRFGIPHKSGPGNRHTCLLPRGHAG